MEINKKIELISTIELFENGQVDLEQTLKKVAQLTGKEVDKYAICNYWTYTSLDNFCDTLLAEPIVDWHTIDEQAALILIREMMKNTANDRILERNGEALEKKYRKTTGFVCNLIFHSEYESDIDILDELKKYTTIYL